MCYSGNAIGHQDPAHFRASQAPRLNDIPEEEVDRDTFSERRLEGEAGDSELEEGDSECEDDDDEESIESEDSLLQHSWGPGALQLDDESEASSVFSDQ